MYIYADICMKYYSLEASKKNEVMPLPEYLQVIFCPIFLRISCFVDEDFLLKIVFAPFYNIIFILCRY